MYEFLEYRVADAMTYRPVTITHATSLADIHALFDEHDFNCLPVSPRSWSSEETAARKRSRWERMPTTRSPDTTGRWRMRPRCMMSSARSSLSATSRVTTSRRMRSRTYMVCTHPIFRAHPVTPPLRCRFPPLGKPGAPVIRRPFPLARLSGLVPCRDGRALRDFIQLGKCEDHSDQLFPASYAPLLTKSWNLRMNCARSTASAYL